MPTMQTEAVPKPSVQLPARAIPLSLVLTGFSLLYFADVLIRASEKYFWYDELFTVYFCRLNLHSLWQALGQGLDFNPPLFYYITKASQMIFGAGQIGTRVPEMVGFWTFLLCLFYVANRRVGPVPGFIAMLFPLFTGASYYSYEARPHAIVLGFAGLAFAFWQIATESRRATLWLLPFSFALVAAFMSHCYALAIVLPFVAAEFYRNVTEKRVDVLRWAAILLPLIAVLPMYLALLRSAHRLLKGTSFNSLRPANWFQFSEYYYFLLGSSLAVLFIAFLLLSFGRMIGPAKQISIPPAEAVAAISFLALPAVGILIGRAVHAPYFHRYFLSALIGVCFCLALLFSFSRSAGRNWPGLIFAVVLTLSLIGGFARLVWHRIHGWGERVIEPSSQFSLNTTPSNPLVNEWLLVTAAQKSIPIMIRNPLEFLYIANYSPGLARRTYFVEWPQPDWASRVFQNLTTLAPRYNPPDSYAHFIDSNSSVYLYGNGEVLGEALDLTDRGWKLKSLESSGDHYLAWIERTATLSETRKPQARPAATATVNSLAGNSKSRIAPITRS